MRRSSFSNVRIALIVGVIALPAIALARASPGNARSFLADMDRAMRKMDADMMVRPVGDVDRDFVAMMVPHHQGAIDMAMGELRYGRNTALRRMAQEIIVDQQQEIVTMRNALGQPLPPSTAAPTGVGTSPHHAGNAAGQEP